MEKILVRFPEGRTDTPNPGEMSVELIYNGRHLIMPYSECMEAKKHYEEKLLNEIKEGIINSTGVVDIDKVNNPTLKGIN